MQLAMAALYRYKKDKERDAAVRRKVGLGSNAEQRRLDALRLSLSIYARLSLTEQDLMELYWDTKFEGKTVDEQVTNKTKEIEERIERTMNAELKIEKA
jgi:hypothetical protein